jgi:molybdopterin converting factor small subunit
VIPFIDKKIRRQGDLSSTDIRTMSQKTLTQTGYFWVKGGSIVTMSGTRETPARPLDYVHADDVIIDGSLCVGNDCYSGLAFGFDTIVLMENNLRIFFDDTSTIQNYPRNDWRIICNDSTDGGGRYFAIEDATEVSNILVLEAGAPDNSIYVDSYGDVGINTSTPYYELHIVDGDSPCVRLDQDGSYGWTPQKWDLCGNESNFFIRDATHASKLPFRIEPDAPTDSIFVKSNGRIGMGTGSPGYALEVERTGENAAIVAKRVSGALCYINATATAGNFGTTTNHPLRLMVNGGERMKLPTSGNLLEMSDGGYYDGTWHGSSSREIKENIQTLTSGEAINALEKLDPVKFNYKENKEDEHVGFIAEDVPELVASKNRKALSAMDVVAVLTKVVKEQQKSIQEHQKTISELQKEIAELKKK